MMEKEPVRLTTPTNFMKIELLSKKNVTRLSHIKRESEEITK